MVLYGVIANASIGALFLAGIRPTVSAARISRPRAARLHAAIREVLARAVAKGGSTLRDFSNAHGESGYFQLEAMDISLRMVAKQLGS